MAFQSVLAAIDISNEKQARAVIAQADKLATLNGAKLDVVTVIPPFGMALVGNFFPKNFEAEALEGARKNLEVLLADIDINAEANGHVRHGTVYEEILKAAKSYQTDLIVMGAHRPELSDYLLGPNAARVVRHAPQTVFIVRD